MIARLDGDVGRLLAALQSAGMTNNVAIFFSSDTGPQKGGGVDRKFFQSAGPFRGGRGELYEGGLRVPMIVRWPGTIPAGQVSDRPWAAWDFLPTALEIAFLNPPPNIDGVSVFPTLTGQHQEPHPRKFPVDFARTRDGAGRAPGRLESGASRHQRRRKSTISKPIRRKTEAVNNSAVAAQFEALLKK